MFELLGKLTGKGAFYWGNKWDNFTDKFVWICKWFVKFIGYGSIVAAVGLFLLALVNAPGITIGASLVLLLIVMFATGLVELMSV